MISAICCSVADSQAPDGVDYDRWLGPAPKRPFNSHRFHRTWRMYRDYGNGEIGDDAGDDVVADDIADELNRLINLQTVSGPRYPAVAQKDIDTELLPGEPLDRNSMKRISGIR